MTEIQKKNKELCDRFPFLIPFNRWSGHRITDKSPGYWPKSNDPPPEYNYEYTELDDMPNGWRKTFGEQMCQEIADELNACGLMEEYRVNQIKEKFGQLRWYGNFDTNKLDDIIDKYSELSEHTCIVCGKPATRISCGWISPFCDDCAAELNCKTVPLQFQEEGPVHAQ